jgi:hypothetical protein
VTFRVPDAQDPTYLYQMISNGGFELGDPADNSLLPYYWRPGTGDRAEHTFTTADQALLPGGECAYGYTNSGGTVAMAPTLANMLTGQGDTVPHGGKRYAEIQGIDATKICSSGLGFWSACTPTRPGDTVRVTLWVKCKNLVPTGASGLSAFVVFSDQTGQHPQQVDLTGGATISGTAAGWTQVTATAVVPGNTKRMQFFFGLAPATGTLWLDDISIKVQ